MIQWAEGWREVTPCYGDLDRDALLANFSAVATIRCPCGAQMALVECTPHQTICECGRVYVMDVGVGQKI